MAKGPQSPLTAEELDTSRSRGWTQKRLAALVGCSEQWLSTQKSSGSLANSEKARRVAFLVRMTDWRRVVEACVRKWLAVSEADLAGWVRALRADPGIGRLLDEAAGVVVHHKQVGKLEGAKVSQDTLGAVQDHVARLIKLLEGGRRYTGVQIVAVSCACARLDALLRGPGGEQLSDAPFQELLWKVAQPHAGVSLPVADARGQPNATSSSAARGHDRITAASSLRRPGDSTDLPDTPATDQSRITERIRIRQLIKPSAGAPFVGRDDTINELLQTIETGTRRILLFHGFGGVGKSTILYHLLKRLEERDYLGLPQVYYWSFYGQGRTDGKPSSGPFLVDAVRHFRQFGNGWLDGIKPDQFGEEVPKAFVTTGGLMILDGMETLQYPPEVHGGRWRDKELGDFLQATEAFAKQDSGKPWLLVITSRWPVPLTSRVYVPKRVESLSADDGARLLRDFRMAERANGALRTYADPDSPAEMATFRQAARAFGCHPLALVLLASYLIEYHKGVLHAWVSLPKVLDSESTKDPHRHAKRILRYFERTLERRERSGHPASQRLARACRQVLGVISLFDRPAEDHLINAVRRGEPIPGLTDGLTPRLFEKAKEHLRELQLLSSTDDELDTHPIIREHFREKLASENAEAWRQGHSRVYQRLAQSLPKAASAERLEQIPRAVFHACQAGLMEVAYEQYEREIKGGFKQDRRAAMGGDSWLKLASAGDSLAFFSNFFVLPWKELLPGLGPLQSIDLLNESGFALENLLMYQEALASFETAIQIAAQAGRGDLASRDSVLRGKAFSALGKLKRAMREAQEAVRYAESLDLPDNRSTLERRVDAYSYLGETYHHLGRWSQARDAFERVRELELEVATRFRLDGFETDPIFAYRNNRAFSFSLDCLRHTHLLGAHTCYELDEMMAKLEVSQCMCLAAAKGSGECDVTINHLLYGKILTLAGLRAKELGRPEAELPAALQHLNEALLGCWRMARMDLRTEVLLALGELCTHLDDLEHARRHLDEVRQTCDWFGLRRAGIDCDLLRCRLHVHPRVAEANKARQLYDRACESVVACEYFRRAPDVLLIGREFQWPVPPEIDGLLL